MHRTLAAAALVLILAGASWAPPAPAATAATPPPSWAEAPGARFYALRLRPGQDLLAELERFARERGLHAAFIASCAGSLRQAALRFANQSQATVRSGHFEIVSLSGTLAADGRHLHAAVADSTGATIGGHLMPGSLVYTTAEIVIGELPSVEFAREVDSTFGYRELVPRPRNSAATSGGSSRP